MSSSDTENLIRDLVLRLVPSNSTSDQINAQLRYAHRLLSSRISPSVVNTSDAESIIKKSLAVHNRHSDALRFSDLVSQSRTQIKNLSSLLYLLHSISEDRRKNRLLSVSIPLLPSPNTRTSSGSGGVGSGGGGGVILMAKDPNNIREIALREYADLVAEETEVNESALVRDVIYVSQGIDGRYVKFDERSDSYEFLESLKVTRSTRIMVKKLVELGFLFRKVRGYIVNESMYLGKEEVGTVGQAFGSALQDELSDYYKLIAILESQSLNSIPVTGDLDSGKGNNSGSYLSLRRLGVWLAEPMVRMRLMAVIVDRCRELKGGAMASAIHGQAQHGDPLVQEFMGRLLRRVCSPLFEMVRSWVLEGELEDMFNEFFIVCQPVKAESLWREGYRIQSSMLPSFISPVLAQRILRTGKSINFLRVCCEDSGWADAASEAAAHVGTTTRRGGLGYGETDALEALVIEAAKRIDRHLMDVIFKKYRFKDHCLAIKRYLLLGQGDFVQYLMDIVGPELSEPANTISSFQLAGLLETAIRASNAQYDDREMLDRLKVKMMEHGDGDRGWDVFSLEYDARVPLDTVFTASNMKRYLKVFNFLWKLRRVEHAMIGVWKTMKPNCIISCSLAKEANVRVQFVSVLRRCQVLWNEMNHFVTNFQDYIMFEVLEVSWAKFSEEMDAAKDLDDLLAAHDKYLGSILEKSLLGDRSQGIIKTLFVLFDRILKFRSLADRWFERINELQNRRRIKSKSRSMEGSWLDGGRKKMIQLAGDFLEKMGEDMDTIAKEYSSSLDTFISQLPLQQHVDLKFLLFRLDFTEYYSRLSPNK